MKATARKMAAQEELVALNAYRSLLSVNEDFYQASRSAAGAYSDFEEHMYELAAGK